VVLLSRMQEKSLFFASFAGDPLFIFGRLFYNQRNGSFVS